VIETQLRLRAMVDRDLTQVLLTEYRFDHPFEADDFDKWARMPKSAMMVVTEGEKIVGHFVYQRKPTSLYVFCLGVHPHHWREKVGTTIIWHLTSWLQDKRDKITFPVRETNLVGQLFLKACGFEWFHTNKEFYSNAEDCYIMQYRRES